MTARSASSRLREDDVREVSLHFGFLCFTTCGGRGAGAECAASAIGGFTSDSPCRGGIVEEAGARFARAEVKAARPGWAGWSMVVGVKGGWWWLGDPGVEVGVSGSLSINSMAEARVRGVLKAGESILEASWLFTLLRRGGVGGEQVGWCAFTHFLWMKLPQGAQVLTGWPPHWLEPQLWQLGTTLVLLAPRWEVVRGTRREEVEVGTKLGWRGMFWMAVLMAESWGMLMLFVSM